MSGQASQLTRKESASKQKMAEYKNFSGGMGKGGDPEDKCMPVSKGLKSNPSSSKG